MIFNIYSSIALENWNHLNPYTKGIGGSELCHIILDEYLRKLGHTVNSFAPLAKEDPTNLPNWRHFSEVDKKAPGTWLVFRDPSFFDSELNPDNRYVFVAQDVDYTWTPERLSKVNTYICLCQAHKRFTEHKYPELRGRVVVSSNGVRRDLIEETEKLGIPRNPHKIIYASSPDRGLELILNNWFRITERVPSAELHVFYGFNNVEELARRVGGWYAEYPGKLLSLMNQPGVKFRGRMNQNDLYKEWFSSNIWWYPSDWPETSCITCMDAQSCGAIPICNDYWAVGENVFHGYMTPGTPQNDSLSKLRQIDYVCDLLEYPIVPWREEMMREARTKFDWWNFVKDYEKLGK